MRQGQDFGFATIQVGQEIGPPWIVQGYALYPVRVLQLLYPYAPAPSCKNFRLDGKRNDHPGIETGEEG